MYGQNPKRKNIAFSVIVSAEADFKLQIDKVNLPYVSVISNTQ